MLLLVCVAVVSAALWWRWRSGYRLKQMINKLPGPTAYPLVGNALQLGTTSHEFNDYLNRTCAIYKDSCYRIWIGPSPYVFTAIPKDLEIILSSNKVLDKGSMYDYILPWIGTGLLTSTGMKWKKHRKILTPTFHFKILEDFVDVFNTNGEILVDKLRHHVEGPGFDVYNYMTLYTLDVISETAMGVKIHAQLESASAYVTAVRDMSEIVMMRAMKPWFGPDFIFNLTKWKRIQDKSLKILHDTTNKVIKQRKEEITAEKALKKATGEEVVDQSDGVKKRLAFLDLLIESTFQGSLLTDENIREEVDTFMFEGHDTTSSGISFTLWILSWHQDIQDQVFQELEQVFPDPDEPVSFRGLQELKYLERVLKESLRMYPSVPLYGRYLHEDLELSGGHLAPKGSTLAILAIMACRDPEVFPDPDRFDPDRFLPENVQGRNPYAYVPFSAGPRNCIGQKFAMLEMKSCIAHVLREYRLLPGSEKPDLVLALEVVLISKSGIKIKLIKR